MEKRKPHRYECLENEKSACSKMKSIFPNFSQCEEWRIVISEILSEKHKKWFSGIWI